MTQFGYIAIVNAICALFAFSVSTMLFCTGRSWMLVALVGVLNVLYSALMVYVDRQERAKKYGD